MRLVIDELEIENRHLTGVAMDSDHTLIFQGRALEDEGERICEGLSKFKKGQIVDVEAELKDYAEVEGIYRVGKIETQIPDVTSSVTARELIYRFYGRLEPVT